MAVYGEGDIVEDIMTVCRERQKRKPEWRKIKFVLSKHIQTNIFNQLNDLEIQRTAEIVEVERASEASIAKWSTAE